MTALDAALAQLAARVRSLPKRPLVALFWACSSALAAEFQAWAGHREASTEPILREALACAREFAVRGTVPPHPDALLKALEASTPAGDSPDEVSSTSAQDCWICADVTIRVLVDPGYDAGPAIEYALEPVLSAATEELFGVSQVATGPEEEAQIRTIMQHPKVEAALEFCRWATDLLEGHPEPTDQELMLVSARATVLAP